MLDMTYKSNEIENVYLEITSPRNKKCSTKNKGDKLTKIKGKSIIVFHEMCYIFILE